jgi:hypothetical protein
MVGGSQSRSAAAISSGIFEALYSVRNVRGAIPDIDRWATTAGRYEGGHSGRPCRSLGRRPSIPDYKHGERLLSVEMSMHAIAFGSAISFIAAIITKLL